MEGLSFRLHHSDCKRLQKALQPRPEDRYSDMCDFVADIASYMKSGAYPKGQTGLRLLFGGL